MSFQAYLDTIEKRTGLTPRELLELRKERGFDGPDTLWLDGMATCPTSDPQATPA